MAVLSAELLPILEFLFSEKTGEGKLEKEGVRPLRGGNAAHHFDPLGADREQGVFAFVQHSADISLCVHIDKGLCAVY